MEFLLGFFMKVLESAFILFFRDQMIQCLKRYQNKKQRKKTTLTSDKRNSKGGSNN